MTTKKIVLIVGGVVVVLGLLVVCFVGGIVGFALYQIGNSEAAAKAKDFLRNSEKLKAEIGPGKRFWQYRHRQRQSSQRRMAMRHCI